jgi:actin-like ATPase involved in cell morphogenesis
MYALGIDLGTTFTAAATWRNGHAEVASLGSRASAIPSVVLLRDDETFLTGEGANRRGLSEPHRVAREFKRRLGDTTPILLGGVPYSAEALMARLLRSVVDEVVAREGGAPDAICVSHPANWGPYKTDLLLQAVRLAGLDEPVSFTTEPEAAAIFYAQQQRIETGSIVAVYDLGGGTFDAAVLRKTAVGFEILGRPEGIERLGGIDFDAAVFSHVAKAIGGKLAELDEDDPSVIAAVARLREECVQAKEALSSDTDVSIPVLLPNLSTEVRLTRAELEAMVRPALYDSIEALKRALRSASVTADQLHAVLLVGGSSRMPVVAQLVGAELGRPVAVDAHPKHSVALGAAWLASGQTAPAPAPRAVSAPVPAPRSGVPGTPPVAVPAPPVPPAPVPLPAPPVVVTPAMAPPPIAPPPIAPTPIAPSPFATGTATVPAPAGAVYPPSAYTTPPAAPAAPVRSRRSLVLIAAGAVLVLALGGAAVALALKPSGNNNTPAALSTSSHPAATTPTTTRPAVVVPPQEQCTDAIKANPRWVCLTRATITGNELRIEYTFNDAGVPFNISNGFHVHIYGANKDGSDPAATVMGAQAPANQRGNWYLEDKQPSVHSAGTSDYDTVHGYPEVCARIADSNHRLVPDSNGTFVTGNCVPLVSK